MKKTVRVRYKLEGMLEIKVQEPVTDESVAEALRTHSDRDLIGGIEGYGDEIEGDAIHVVEFENVK